MLLHSMRVTEKILAVVQVEKKQFWVAAKAVKTVHSSTQSFGTKQLKQFYKYGR